MGREPSKTGGMRVASTAVTGRAKPKSATVAKTRRRERRIDWRETKKARLARPRRAR